MCRICFTGHDLLSLLFNLMDEFLFRFVTDPFVVCSKVPFRLCLCLPCASVYQVAYKWWRWCCCVCLRRHCPVDSHGKFSLLVKSITHMESMNLVANLTIVWAGRFVKIRRFIDLFKIPQWINGIHKNTDTCQQKFDLTPTHVFQVKILEFNRNDFKIRVQGYSIFYWICVATMQFESRSKRGCGQKSCG